MVPLLSLQCRSQLRQRGEDYNNTSIVFLLRQAWLPASSEQSSDAVCGALGTGVVENSASLLVVMVDSALTGLKDHLYTQCWNYELVEALAVTYPCTPIIILTRRVSC